MRSALSVGLTVLLALTFCAQTATAKGRTIYKLALTPPKEVLQAEGEGKTAYADMAVKKLRKRFAAASVKEFELRVMDPSNLELETGWDHSRGWLEALLTSPGRLEVRRSTKGPDWLEFARQLPEGVQLRGDKPPYLWCARRSTLEGFLTRLAVPNKLITVFPDDGGFRSVSLGEVVGTQRQVRSASARQSSTGAPFVEIEFESAVGASLAAAHVSDVEMLAIVLDGEVIAFVRAKSFSEQSLLRLSVPNGAVAGDRRQQGLWVQQVAGRLAAPLPIPIAVLKE